MRHLEAHFKATTPMFLGSARPSQQAQRRAASLKGAVRFWWRANAWSGIRDLEALRARDGELFGSREHGQSQVLVSWHSGVPEQITPDEAGAWGERFAEHGLRYLSFGLTQRDRQRGVTLQRAFLPAFDFTTRWMVAPPQRPEDEQTPEELLRALRALGALGGLGSKARRGFGSVVLREVRSASSGEVLWTAPASFEALHEELRALLADAPQDDDTLPPFTALSARSRVLLLEGNEGDTPLELLDRVGRELVRFRSFGVKGRVLDGERSERNFRGDHDVMRRALQGKRPRQAPDRIAFGLPQPYFFTSLRSGGSVQPVDEGRRASPLMIHMHTFDEGPPCAVLTFLPAQFLPENAQVQLGRHAVSSEDEALWRPIKEWFERLEDTSRCRECFQRRLLCVPGEPQHDAEMT